MTEEKNTTEEKIKIEKISLPPVITVKDFAEKTDKPVSDIIKLLLDNGFLANINETLDFETAALITSELGMEAEEEKIDEKKADLITPEELGEILRQENKEGADLKIRPPIVTILGHVDHGKTTLLDTIRKTNIAEKESGGITQHITSYQVKVKDRSITFVDTPGHEAFSQMRARGSGIADIAILIVAADDGVKPQTKEVIENLKKGKVPMIVAINKIDKPGANPEKAKGQLAEAGILLEKRGGEVPAVEISAKNNLNIEDLLENILLLADILEIKCKFNRNALGLILESHLDQRKGAVATAIIKTGTLNEGDSIIAGSAVGTVRQLLDHMGKRIIKAEPGSAVTIVGLDSVSKAGSVLQVEESRVKAKEKTKRFKLTHDIDRAKANVKKIKDEEKEALPKLNIIVKADVEGSLEALRNVLMAIVQEEAELEILTEKVGNITETDVQLAATTGAIVYGFKVQIPEMVKHTADKNKVKIKNFDIIYKLIEDVKEEMSQLLPPEIVRTDLGKLQVLAVFRTEKDRMIIGGRIKQGKIVNHAFFEIERNKEIIGKGRVGHLQHNKADVVECKEGLECGISYLPIGPMAKILEGDILNLYLEEERIRKIK